MTHASSAGFQSKHPASPSRTQALKAMAEAPNAGEAEADEPFAVTAERGFLPVRDPLPRLPTTGTGAGAHCVLYAALESLGDDIPKLLVCGNETLRQQIEARLSPSVVAMGLPPPLSDDDGAGGRRRKDELERVLLLVSFIAHAYVWGRPNSEPAASLPDPLASTWIAAAEARERLPILTYSSFNLYNWRPINPDKPVDLGNICCLNNFLGGIDEEHFRLVHVAIEARAIPAVASMLHYANTGEGLVEALRAITESLGQIQAMLSRMGEACDPTIYYKRVREYMGGWRNNPRLPHGLVYGSHGRQELYGETGAQSAIIPAFDAFLGVVHEMDEMREYLLEMRRYMPRPHVAFIERLEGMRPSVREQALRAAAEAGVDGELVAAYDEAMGMLAQFRARHLVYADRYIKKPAVAAQQPAAPEARQGDVVGAGAAVDAAAAEVGTGGSDFVPYLEKHHRETKAHVIRPPR